MTFRSRGVTQVDCLSGAVNRDASSSVLTSDQKRQPLMTRRLPLLLGALAFATAFKLGAGTAEANHVHFGGHVSGHWSGSVHIGGGGSVYVGGGAHYSRPYWRPYRNWSVGGHV